MAMSSKSSCLLSLCILVVVFAAMQLYKSQLASSQLMTVLGGAIGSVFFMLLLTAIGNLETSLFGKNFQTKLFPEVVLSMVLSMVVSGLVHRVCLTTCFLFSLLNLYYMNRVSTRVYASAPTHNNNQPAPTSHRKKK